jgi:hypothetical protein
MGGMVGYFAQSQISQVIEESQDQEYYEYDMTEEKDVVNDF